MTVSTETSTTGPREGDGSNNLWSFDFPVQSASQVQLVRRSAGGSDTVIDGALYTVALQDSGRGGGVVTYPTSTARVPAGEFVTLRRNPSFVQPAGYRNQSAFDGAEIERSFDRLTYQTQALRERQGRSLELGPSYSLDTTGIVPSDGKYLRWTLLSTGAYRIDSQTSLDLTDVPEIRVLYANDLQLRGDGSDELAEMNSKFLEISEDGGAIVYLKAPAGYWPITGELKVRSGIQLAWGSPLRFSAAGSIVMLGNYGRETSGGTITTATGAGATVVPVTPVGSTLSSAFAANDQIELPSGERVRVTGVDDDAETLTVTPATTEALTAGGSVRKLLFAYLTSNITRGDDPIEIAVDTLAPFEVGNVVWLTDDETTLQNGTGGATLVNSELAKIVGFGSGTIKLDRAVRHGFTTANRARIIRLNPCTNASVANGQVTFIEAPSSTRVDTFRTSLAYQCNFEGCQVSNDDNFGSRGQAFRIFRSYQCAVNDGYHGPSKYVAAGEGRSVELREATSCRVSRLTSIGARHGISFSTATDCRADEPVIRSWRNNAIDYHGLREINCWVYNLSAVGGGLAAQFAVAFGNPSWRAGCFDCGVFGSEVSGCDGAESGGVIVWAPSDNCQVWDVDFRRVYYGLYAENQDNDTDLHIGSIRFNSQINHCEYGIRCDMDAEGGSAEPFTRLDISGSEILEFAKNAVWVDNADELQANGITLRSSRQEVGEYAISVENVAAPWITNFVIEGARRGVRFSNAPVQLFFGQFRNIVQGTILNEASTSTDWRERFTVCVGFSPTRTTTSTEGTTNVDP